MSRSDVGDGTRTGGLRCHEGGVPEASEDLSAHLTADERRFLAMVRKLDEHGRDRLEGFMDSMLDAQRKGQSPDFYLV